MSDSILSNIIEILSYEDTDDGGAIIHLSISPEVQQALIQEGLITVLKRSIEEGLWDDKQRD